MMPWYKQIDWMDLAIAIAICVSMVGCTVKDVHTSMIDDQIKLIKATQAQPLNPPKEVK